MNCQRLGNPLPNRPASSPPCRGQPSSHRSAAPPNPQLPALEHGHTAEDPPDSYETPVDSELQERLPNLLALILADIWAGRLGWFFGIDMALYYSPLEPAVVPDAFLSLGVDRIKDENLRLSYVLWEERNILPTIVLEVVSKKYRGEYSSKKELYRSLGILYYVIYNSRRRRKPTLEVHKLVQGQYQQILGGKDQGDRVWIPEIGLAIGKERATYQEVTRDWLFWYDEAGTRYPTPQERADQEQARAQQAQEQAQQAQEQAQQAQEQAQQAQEQAQQAQEQAQQARAQAEQEQARAEQEQARAEQEQARAEQALARAEQAELRSLRLGDRLRALGINPDEL